MAIDSRARIGIIGDRCDEIPAHVAIPRAIDFAANQIESHFELCWLETSELARVDAIDLTDYDALWCVPGSPYASMEGALRAIRFAREHSLPFLGTCGGFQHALIEYARNVLDRRDADHQESNPNAAMQIVNRLSCSMVGAKSTVHVVPGSRLESIYMVRTIEEEYNCNFGMNPKYESMFFLNDLHVAGIDSAKAVQAVELAGHPFFIAVLFQPERSAFSGKPHPIICTFLQEAASRAALRRANQSAVTDARRCTLP